MTDSFTKYFKRIADSRAVNLFIVGCIIITSASIGLETYPAIALRWGKLLSLIDKIILGIFVVEQLIRLLAEGKRPWRYFMDPWNLFDFLIVTICLLPLHQSSIAIVRLVRILRVLRLFKALPRLRMIINGMIKSLSSVGYVAALLVAHFYIFAVIGITAFASNDVEHFGNLGRTFLTLFQILTLENWPDVMAPVKLAHPTVGVLYFVAFIVTGTMVVMNLFVGVIVGSMSEAFRDDKNEPAGKPFQDNGNVAISESILQIEKELGVLGNRLRSLNDQIKFEQHK